MPYVVKTSEDKMICLPQELTKHLAGAGENDLKVILCIYAEFSESGFTDSDIAEIARKLSIDMGEAESAVAFWRGAGIIKRGKIAASKSEAEKIKVPSSDASKPIYPAAQVAEAIESVPGMKNLVEFCQRRMGVLFNPSQLSTLYSFYDTLGFDTEVIMLAVEYCCGIEKKSLNYVHKVLISLSESGINGYEDTEIYFKNRLEYRTNEGKIRKLCGFTSRELTPSEKKIIGVWFNEWHTDFSLIEKAYEITVDRTSKPSLKYMNAILADWNNRGITSADAVEGGKPAGGIIEKSHDADDFFKAAVAKSMGADAESTDSGT